MTKIHTQSEPQASSPSPPYLDPAQCPHEHTSTLADITSSAVMCGTTSQKFVTTVEQSSAISP